MGRRKLSKEKIKKCRREIQKVEKQIAHIRASQKFHKQLKHEKKSDHDQSKAEEPREPIIPSSPIKNDVIPQTSHSATVNTEQSMDTVKTASGSTMHEEQAKETNILTQELPETYSEAVQSGAGPTSTQSQVENIKPEVDGKNVETEEIDNDFDTEYLPQCWATKFEKPEEVVEQYITFITTESELATNSIPHELNVRYGSKVQYGSSKGQKLDILGTDLPDDAPILVFIPGGYWKDISKDISRFPALPLYKAGVKTIVVGYNQRPRVTLWDISDQVMDAICFVLKYAREKGSRGIYLAGHGSGAHLIAHILSNDELFTHDDTMKKFFGIFLISGLYDLKHFSTTTANNRVGLLREDEINFSPIYHYYNHLEHINTRFYILAADEDSPTYKSQSRDFYNLLFDICPMGNMHFEVKDNMDHYEIVKCLSNENNYLKNLILHDLRTYSHMHSTE